MSIIRCFCGESSSIPTTGISSWQCPSCSATRFDFGAHPRRRGLGPNPVIAPAAAHELGLRTPLDSPSEPKGQPKLRHAGEPSRRDGRSGIFGQIYEAPRDTDLHRRIGSTQRGDDVEFTPNLQPFRVEHFNVGTVKHNCPICGDWEGVSSYLVESGEIEFVCDARHPRTNNSYKWRSRH